jgi:hypothetical protein
VPHVSEAVRRDVGAHLAQVESERVLVERVWVQPPQHGVLAHPDLEVLEHDADQVAELERAHLAQQRGQHELPLAIFGTEAQRIQHRVHLADRQPRAEGGPAKLLKDVEHREAQAHLVLLDDRAAFPASDALLLLAPRVHPERIHEQLCELGLLEPILPSVHLGQHESQDREDCLPLQPHE